MLNAIALPKVKMIPLAMVLGGFLFAASSQAEDCSGGNFVEAATVTVAEADLSVPSNYDRPVQAEVQSRHVADLDIPEVNIEMPGLDIRLNLDMGELPYAESEGLGKLSLR